MPGSDLILYDGICGLCNRLCRFVLRRDRRHRFLFAPLQSTLAAEILSRHGLKAGDLDTLVVVARDPSDAEIIFTRSRAVFYVLRSLGGFWRLPALARLLPAALLDRGYDLVARRRYGLFGRYDACPLPAPADRERFLGLTASSASPPSASGSERSGPGVP